MVRTRIPEHPKRDLVAFVDESQRGPTFLVGAVIIDVNDLRAARQMLRTQVKPGQRRIHFSKESDTRRSVLLTTFEQLPAENFVVVTQGPAIGRSTVDQRAACLSHLATELLGVGVTQIELDHVEAEQQRRDRRTLARVIGDVEVTYLHHPAHAAEPLLWAADGITWAAGAERWRLRIRPWVSLRRIP